MVWQVSFVSKVFWKIYSNFFSSLKCGQKTIAASLWSRYTRCMFANPEKNIARLDIRDGMKVADIGSGSGFYTFEAARRAGLNGRVYAVEILKDLLDRTKNVARTNGLSNIEAVWGDVEKIGGTKLRDVSVDRVIASNILSQIETKDDFCLEIKRILKPDGKVLLIDWSERSPLSPKNLVSAPMAQAYFEKAGFTISQNFDAGDHHYGILFVKPGKNSDKI